MDLSIVFLLLCFNIRLDGSHSSEVLQFDVIFTDDISSNNISNSSIELCPYKRPEPLTQILSSAITFPEEHCRLRQTGSNTDSQCDTHGKCQKIIPVANNLLNGSFTLSMLVGFTCKKDSVMQVYHWYNVAMYLHCNAESPGHVSIKITKSVYVYKLYQSQGHVHLLLQVKEGEQGKGSYQVYINSTLLTERTLSPQKILASRDIIVFGKEDDKGESDIGPFIGTVLAADLLPPHLSQREMNLEAVYMKNLALGLAYPECTCPPPSIPLPSDVLCSNGQSRLTGNNTDNNYIFTDKALSDGIMNTSLNYGFLSVTNSTWSIRIKLHHPAQMMALEIYTFRQEVDVFIESGSSQTILFWMSSYNDSKQSSHWENVSGSSLSKLVWNHTSEPLLKIVSSLVIRLNNLGSEKTTETPTVIPGNGLYEVIIQGRPLDPLGFLEECYCFPMNGQRTDVCDGCGNCQCRTGGELADKYCRPYVTSIEPAFGPESGGTLITIHGGLLKPNLPSPSLAASVTIGRESSCFSVEHGDSSIICEVQKMVQYSTNTPQRVEEHIPVGYALYKIENELKYTFRPDPVIKSITPYKALSSGGVQLTVTGENLDSIQNTSTKHRLMLTVEQTTKHGTCLIKSRNVMMCTTPVVDEETDVVADIGFTLDGVTKYLNMTAALPSLGTFTLHPDPRFHQKDVIRTGDIIKLEGETIDDCCNVKEYFVNINGLPCPVREGTANFMTCVAPEFEPGTDEKIAIMVHWYNRRFKAGFYVLQTSSSIDGVIIGSVFSCAVLLGGLLCVFTLYKRGKITLRRNRQEVSELEPLEPRPRDDIDDASTDILQTLDDGLKHIVENCLIRGKVLQIGTQVGRGNFGKVFKGKLVDGTSETEVALKTLREGSSVTKEELSEFVEEATIMKDFTHPNVLTLLGIIIEKGMLYVALPFMANGDLRKYVARQMFDCVAFIRLVLDVAHGMMYLSKKKFVHRDLAARNCMVNETGSVMIGDFGLARDIYQRDYYRPDDKQRPLPFKWMAPESLDKRIFTTKSDVWAMGILMWEVFTNGSMPYPAIENRELLLHLLHGYCLERPDNCPESLYLIMKSCWDLDPLLRPTFEKIMEQLTQVLDDVSAKTTMSPSSPSASSQVTYYNEEAFPKIEKSSGQKLHPHINEDEDAKKDARKGMPPTPAKRKSLGGMLGRGGGVSLQCLLDSTDTDSPVPSVIRSAEESLDEEGYLKPL